MYETQSEERREQAKARGEALRAEITAMLENEGPQRAADLLPHLPEDVSLAEVDFQLERLTEEGETVGEPDGPYSLT